jgi:hypothetical protein
MRGATTTALGGATIVVVMVIAAGAAGGVFLGGMVAEGTRVGAPLRLAPVDVRRTGRRALPM